jgi:hypothetical protein
MAVHGESGTVTRHSLHGVLSTSWWIVFPCFSVLVARFSGERACADPYDLLPALTSTPAGAWPLAIVYVAAHGWIVTAYLITVSRAAQLLPGPAAVRRMWGRDAFKLFAMVMAFAIEYAPMALWRLAGSGCRYLR